MLGQPPDTTPHAGGVLVLDETGDRKWGTKTAYGGRQYVGAIGQIAHGVVLVRSLWADAHVYDPLEVEPYTPACWFAKGQADSAFRTKPAMAIELVKWAPLHAVVAEAC